MQTVENVTKSSKIKESGHQERLEGAILHYQKIRDDVHMFCL